MHIRIQKYNYQKKRIYYFAFKCSIQPPEIKINLFSIQSKINVQFFMLSKVAKDL